VDSMVSHLSNPMAALPLCTKKGEHQTKGEVLKFRKDNEVFRGGLKADVKKADSVEGSGFGDTASSVPYKVTSCLAQLSRVLGDLPSHAHVFGVGDDNYGAPALAESFSTLTYFDPDKAGDRPHATTATKMDMTALPPGSGKGLFIADDTAPDDPYKKLEVIAKAGYDCGFVKCMYGWGSDGDLPTQIVHPAVLGLFDQYGYVDFLRFSPHSEEYYIIFGTAVVGPAKWESLLSPSPNDPIGRGRWELRARTIQRVFAVEIYTANILKSARARSAVRGLRLPPSVAKLRMPLPPINKILLGGHTVGGKIRDSVARTVSNKSVIEEDSVQF